VRRDEARHDDNRRGEPPRAWSGPPRSDGGRANDSRSWDRDHDRREQTWNRGMYQRDWRGDRNSYNRYPNRSYGYYRDYDRHDYGRGYSGQRRWSRGERLPYGYYARDRWERDYWRYDLYDPRDGCGWVRSDGDALLVVLASGLVLDAVYDVFR
jgi:Ni/Co efflux regulator RcnB